MKKKLSIGLIIALCLIGFTSCATTTSSEPPKTSSITVIEVPGKTADELFVLANSWAVNAFNSAEAVIEYSDKEAGIIKGNFTTEVGNFWVGVVNTKTTMTIETKEGKARIMFTDPMMKYSPDTLFVPQGWIPCNDDRLPDLNSIWDIMIFEFSNALNSTPSEW